MLDEKTRVAVALKKFSLISPIINGQVKSKTEYVKDATREPIEMPHYGFKKYSPKTINVWYSDYMRGGVEALKPSPRADRGVSRALTPETCGAILGKLKEYPKTPTTVIYDMLVGEGAFLKKDVSIATVRRFVKENRKALAEDGGKAQMLRFSHEGVNHLWMTDIMYGPYVGAKKKKATYLLAYIDDASRLITHGGFYLTQDFAALRGSFKEAILRRGVPRAIYTDNGKIYRSQSFEYLCANLGVALLHHDVGQAHQKGKIERFFRTVRLRFLSALKPDDIPDVGTLNEKFQQWLLDDYQKRPHQGLSGETPLGVFLKQAGSIEMVTDLGEFNKKLLVSVKRTVKKDATISLGGNLYETDTFLAGDKLEVRYEPDAGDGIMELFLHKDGAPVGTARLVCFTDNAKRKRAGRANDAAEPDKVKPKAATGGSPVYSVDATPKTNTISYSDAMGGEA